MANIWSVVVEYFLIFTDWIDERWVFVLPVVIFFATAQGRNWYQTLEDTEAKKYYILHTIMALLFTIVALLTAILWKLS